MLTSISRSKGNQAMKFGQLIEYNMRNIFLKKLHTECGGETIRRPFKKIKIEQNLWINSLKFYTIRFYCMPS